MSEVIVIAGPTASGKSQLGVAVSERLDGEIVNADAMQVYSDLSVLTARPSAEEMRGIPHHLYGVSGGEDVWSAGRYAKAAAMVIEDIIVRGRRPIIVGGTGLWLKALVSGLSPMPEVSAEVMQAANAHMASIGKAAFRAEVLADDPAMEWLQPADTQRHLRAWSVHKSTGTPLSVWQAMPPVRLSSRTFQPAVLMPDREQLYAHCDRRLLGMIEQGALEEVRALIEKELPPQVPVMKAVGVPEFAAHLSGDMELPDAIAAAQQSTRRLAKRQMTWFRGQAGDWPTATSPETLLSMI